MNAVAAVAQDSPAGLDLVTFMDNKINLAGGLIMRMRERFLMSFEEQVYCEWSLLEHVPMCTYADPVSALRSICVRPRRLHNCRDGLRHPCLGG